MHKGLDGIGCAGVDRDLDLRFRDELAPRSLNPKHFQNQNQARFRVWGLELRV